MPHRQRVAAAATASPLDDASDFLDALHTSNVTAHHNAATLTGLIQASAAVSGYEKLTLLLLAQQIEATLGDVTHRLECYPDRPH